MRIVLWVVTVVFLCFITTTTTPVPVFTRRSVEKANEAMKERDLQFLFLAIKNESDPRKDVIIDRVWIVVWESILFLRPYTLAYTLETINEKFIFHSLNPVLSNFSYDPELPLSRWGQAVLNETNLLSMRPSAQYPSLLLCSPANDFNQVATQDRDYNCFDILTNETRVVVSPLMLRLQESTMNTLQVAIVVGFTYYVNLKLYHIRRASKHYYVSDSLYNPPYWQYILPFITRAQKVNGRLWDSIWLSLIFIVTYVLALASAFSPRHWPRAIGEQWTEALFQDGEIRFLIITAVMILLNTVLAASKIVSHARHDHRGRIDLPKTWYVRMIAYLVSFLLSAASTALIAVYVKYVFPEHLALETKAIFGLAVSIYGIVMTVYLCKKHIYVARWVQNIILKADSAYSHQKKVDDDYMLLDDNTAKQPTYSARSALLTFLIILSTWIVSCIWHISLIILSFRAGTVVVRFFASTIANILLNSDMIPTYSYCASIVGVLYKFSLDIEKPYIRLKNMIAKERGSLNMLRIKATATYLRKVTIHEMKSDLFLLKERLYYMPLKWNTFAKISEMVHLPEFTRRVLLQMLFTVFVLCVFFIAAKSHNKEFFAITASGNNNSIIAVLVGTVMPLIPRIISYFNDTEDGMDSTVFNERLKNSLKIIERKAENNTKENFDWSVPSSYVPFRFTLVSVVSEPKAQRDEEPDDMPFLIESNTSVTQTNPTTVNLSEEPQDIQLDAMPGLNTQSDQDFVTL